MSMKSCASVGRVRDRHLTTSTFVKHFADKLYQKVVVLTPVSAHFFGIWPLFGGFKMTFGIGDGSNPLFELQGANELW